LVGVPLLCVILASCNQSARLAEPSAGTVPLATSDPFVLNGVAYTQGDANTRANAAAPPPANADVVAAPPAGTPQPVVSATPLPPTDPALALPPVAATQQPIAQQPIAQQPIAQQPVAPVPVAPAPAVPAAPLAAANPPAPSTTADGFPNINIAPQPTQPQTKLLTPEERAKLIEELNALAGRSNPQ